MALSVAFLKYGRDDERESDRLGMEYASQGGWDPTGVPHFLATLARVDETQRARRAELAVHASRSRPRASSKRSRSPRSWRLRGRRRAQPRRLSSSSIDGIVVGDNPKDGIVRGNAFLHPALRFALEFPEGWDVMNTPTQVAAREPGQPHYMLLQMVDQPRGRTSRGDRGATR